MNTSPSTTFAAHAQFHFFAGFSLVSPSITSVAVPPFASSSVSLSSKKANEFSPIPRVNVNVDTSKGH